MNARSPDAADADDLVRHVDDFEPLEEVAAIVRQRLAVGAELLVDHLLHLVDREPDPRCQVSQRDHDRRLADDPVSAIDVLGQLRQRLQAVASARLSRLLLGGSSARSCRPSCCPPVPRRCAASCDTAHELLLRQVCVPDVQGAHLGELGHLCSIARDRLERRGARIGWGEAVVAGRDREARRHALHVVLERTGKRLVEVVQPEHQRSFG